MIVNGLRSGYLGRMYWRYEQELLYLGQGMRVALWCQGCIGLGLRGNMQELWFSGRRQSCTRLRFRHPLQGQGSISRIELGPKRELGGLARGVRRP